MITSDLKDWEQILQFQSKLLVDEINLQFKHFTTFVLGFRYKTFLQCVHKIFSFTTGSQCGDFKDA